MLNNCQVPFKGTRTKDFIIICSPELYSSLPDLIYIIFHEIRHEIQMGELKQINPLSGDLENFDELYDIYWKILSDISGGSTLIPLTKARRNVVIMSIVD